MQGNHQVTADAHAALIEGGHYDLCCPRCKRLIIGVTDDDLLEECDSNPEYRQALTALHSASPDVILDAGKRLRDIRNQAAARIISRIHDRADDHRCS